MQISGDARGKLDEELVDLVSNAQLNAADPIPVVFRCAPGSLAGIADAVRASGGSVRNHLKLIGALATWIPIRGVLEVVNDERVLEADLDSPCAVA